MSEKARIKTGAENLKRIDGEAGQRVMDSLKDIAPAVGQYIMEFAFGDIYSRKGLDLKQREIITISCLLTQGNTENQLKVHLNGCLNVGITEAEIIECFTQCIPYVGFPKVLNAISVAQQVFDSYKHE